MSEWLLELLISAAFIGLCVYTIIGTFIYARKYGQTRAGMTDSSPSDMPTRDTGRPLGNDAVFWWVLGQEFHHESVSTHDFNDDFHDGFNHDFNNDA